MRLQENDKNEQRNVFLFGAGAIISWGGPRTICYGNNLTYLPERDTGEIENRVCCLTHLIKETGFFCKSGIRISQRIVEGLLENGLKEEEINFETIFNVIEELIVYYSKFSKEQVPSLLSAFLNTKEILDDILNFKVEGETVTHGYKLIIPKNENNYKGSYQNETPEQFFLQLLMVDLLDGIIGHISKYSNYSNRNTRVVENEVNKSLNDGFYNWIKNFTGNNGIVRMYTLNYDRLFKVILANRHLNVFEGFECGASTNPEDEIPPNIQRILSDSNSHVHYNLHGSAYWDINSWNNKQLPASEFYLKGAPCMPSNLWQQSTRQMDKGKTTLMTNIITGYQKTVRTSVTPFKQMLSAFDKDCIFADRLFIIGYGFGDEHINESLKTALIHNKNLKIIIIDPGFITNKIDEKLAIELFSHSKRNLSPKNVADNQISFLNGQIEVYTKKFSDIF
ncbi:MAG: SIR2 family protein [Adhaeribacter sp.]